MQETYLVFGALKNGGKMHVYANKNVEIILFFGKNIYVAILCLFYIPMLLLLRGLHTLKQARNVEAVNIYKLLTYCMNICHSFIYSFSKPQMLLPVGYSKHRQ